MGGHRERHQLVVRRRAAGVALAFVASAGLLEERREKGDCVVSRAGYLDLFGGAWGCVLQGGDWAEILIVSESAAGGGCDVVISRMSAEELGSLQELC